MSAAKITDLLKSKNFSYSFEVTPNIPLDTIDSFSSDPVFYSITWHAKSYEFKNLDIAPLKLASHLKSKGKNVLLHLSCDMLKRAYLDDILRFLEEKGICNLFVMLGESYDPNSSDFKNTKELIEYIRKRNGEYFCVGVAGFPDNNEDRLKNLKENVEIGANFILTQAFFDSKSYKNFANKCKSLGITVPIIPGLFLYETHKDLVNFSQMCAVKVSNDLLEHAKTRDTDTGKEVIKKVIDDIRKSDLGMNHFHFFTLNKLDKVSKFVKEIV